MCMCQQNNGKSTPIVVKGESESNYSARQALSKNIYNMAIFWPKT